MDTKTIKKLANASYTKEKLDQEKVNKIAKLLTKRELKNYIKELKIIENKNRVYVYLAKLEKTSLINEFKKLYPNKEIIFVQDESLISGIRVVDNDLIFDQNIKNNLNEIVNYIGQ